MYFTQFLQLGLFALGFVDVGWIIEEVHEIARDLAELGDLKRNSPRSTGLGMCLADARVCDCAPRLCVLDRKDFEFWDRKDRVGQLGHPSEVVTPALVE